MGVSGICDRVPLFHDFFSRCPTWARDDRSLTIERFGNYVGAAYTTTKVHSNSTTAAERTFTIGHRPVQSALRFSCSSRLCSLVDSKPSDILIIDSLTSYCPQEFRGVDRPLSIVCVTSRPSGCDKTFQCVSIPVIPAYCAGRHSIYVYAVP